MELSFWQKKTLAAFECFFGANYATNAGGDNNTSMHVEAQKMCYLLKVYGIEIGDFNYSWDLRGPFSPGLLVLLRSIDNNSEHVDNFYNADPSTRSRYLSGYEEEICRLSDGLNIQKYADDPDALSKREAWVEMLGSMTYISRSNLPGADFNAVSEKLCSIKPELVGKLDANAITEAWERLKSAKLLITVD